MLAMPALMAGGCAAPGGAAAGSGASDYVLVTLRTGPRAGSYPDAERTSIQTEHLENIGRLAEEHQLVAAGPYGQANHDPSQRGLFILNVKTFEEAQALSATDPAVAAGVLAMDFELLRTDADLVGALDLDLALEAEAARAGRVRPVQEGMRKYVILRSDDGRRAAAALAAATPATMVVLEGTVDGSRGFFILDAMDLATAQAWVEAQARGVGTCTLDEWYGSASLAEIAR